MTKFYLIEKINITLIDLINNKFEVRYDIFDHVRLNYEKKTGTIRHESPTSQNNKYDVIAGPYLDLSWLGKFVLALNKSDRRKIRDIEKSQEVNKIG